MAENSRDRPELGWRQSRQRSAQRLAFEYDPVRVVHQAVEEGVGAGGVADQLVPLPDVSIGSSGSRVGEFC